MNGSGGIERRWNWDTFVCNTYLLEVAAQPPFALHSMSQWYDPQCQGQPSTTLIDESWRLLTTSRQSLCNSKVLARNSLWDRVVSLWFWLRSTHKVASECGGSTWGCLWFDSLDCQVQGSGSTYMLQWVALRVLHLGFGSRCVSTKQRASINHSYTGATN